VRYTGQADLQRDLGNLKHALKSVGVDAGFYPSTAPGIVLDYYPNQYYKNDKECLFAIADALAWEYEAIAGEGFLLQIDAPDLAQNYSFMNFADIPSYLAETELRVEALNHALRKVAKERIRVHVCWGSWWGPHQTDIPLQEIVNLLLKVKMSCLSIEAATVNHAADWHIWEQTRIPDDLMLMPGVITHKTHTIEDPRFVAEQLLRYANIVGRERVIAGTDCGMVRCPAQSIAWAKFQAMVEGAQLATRDLWK
jgi:5-methyltetrahydropteroyltriglutamate--homocysteine methyltransferase